VGFSFGGPEDETYYIMETHYDNPSMRADVIDDSGKTVYMSRTEH